MTGGAVVLPPLPSPRTIEAVCDEVAGRERVDAKLREVGLTPLNKQPARFGKSPKDLAELEGQIDLNLKGVVRYDETRFDLAAMLKAFDALWDKQPS